MPFPQYRILNSHLWPCSYSSTDLGFHREHGNINVGGPPVQTRSHTKYVNVQPYYNDANDVYLSRQQNLRHEPTW